MTEIIEQSVVEFHSLLNKTLVAALTILFPSIWERLKVQHPGCRRVAAGGLTRPR